MLRSSWVMIGAAFVLTQCTANRRDFTPEKVAGVIPILTGAGLAAACNQVFSGRNTRDVATAVCGGIGVLIGQKIKQALKEREQVQLAEATNTTLRTGKTQTVKTAEGNTITTELVKPAPAQVTRPQSPPPKPLASVVTVPPAPASAVQVAAVGDECGTIKQTLITRENQRIEDEVKVCKKGETWVAA